MIKLIPMELSKLHKCKCNGGEHECLTKFVILDTETNIEYLYDEREFDIFIGSPPRYVTDDDFVNFHKNKQNKQNNNEADGI